MFDQAVDALTRVARISWSRARPGGTTTPAERFDWARFVTDTVAAAAANVGSTDVALAGTPPDTFHASAVRDLLAGTVGAGDERLLPLRTMPVVVDVPVGDILDRAGVCDAYKAAHQELAGAYDADPDATPAERERRAAELHTLQERLEEQRRQDWAGYATALMGHIWQAADALGVGCHVRIDPAGDRTPSPHRSVADQLLDQAVAAVALPGDGRAPLDRLRGPTQHSCADSTPHPGPELSTPVPTAAAGVRSSTGHTRRELAQIPRATTPTGLRQPRGPARGPQR
jgi:hypothetical protein